jgi:hypothetical protein
MEGKRDLLQSLWPMLIYNNAPDRYQLVYLSRSVLPFYTYESYLVDYELNRNDHHQTVSCVFTDYLSQSATIINITQSHVIHVEFKAHLYGHYYFTRSFNSHSSIDIDCEEFDGNPKPVYTLLWMLNGENRTLLNKATRGHYTIPDATWRHRGKHDDEIE